MAAITTDFTAPTVDGTWVGINGTFHARTTATVDMEGSLGLTEPFQADIVDGVVADLDLDETEAGVWAWLVTVQSRTGRTYSFCKAVPAGAGPVDFDDLDDVDPVTLGPPSALTAAWVAALADKQPLDSDLTAIAALTTTSFGRSLLTLADQAALTASNAAASTTASGIVELATQTEVNTGTDADRAVTPSTLTNATAVTGKQPLDSDLTAFAALSPANDDIVQRKAGAWTNRTLAQLKTDLTIGIPNYTGSGSPEGVVTAAVGSLYSDTAVTNGAAVWRKNTGAGNTGWVVGR